MRCWALAARGLVLALLAASAGCDISGAAQEPTERGPDRAEFERLFGEWKPFLKELWQVKEDYAEASPEEQAVLRQRYDEMVEKGYALEGALIDAAVIACVRDPAENEDLAGFLLDVANAQLQKEEYEDALRSAQTLVDHRIGASDRGFYWNYYVAAISAFAVGEYELSEKHFQLLDKNYVRLGKNNPFRKAVADCRENMAYYKEAWKKEQKIREQEERKGDLPRVLLNTTKGEIELELFEDQAPNTVANFISLVEKGFYTDKGNTFHRVVSQLAAQAGCPKGDGTGGPGYTIRCECYRPDHRLHFRGSLSMAHKGPNTGGSQFFILFRPSRNLDGMHTVFGRVVRGIEVLARLQRRKPPDPINAQFVRVPKPDKILEAKVLRKRNHPYEPKITPDEEEEDLPEEMGREFMTF